MFTLFPTTLPFGTFWHLSAPFGLFPIFLKIISFAVIPGFMCQGGDFTAGNGTGGKSIYGEKVWIETVEKLDFNLINSFP